MRPGRLQEAGGYYVRELGTGRFERSTREREVTPAK